MSHRRGSHFGKVAFDQGDGARPVAEQLDAVLRQNHARVLDLFRSMDTSGNGEISRSEFHDAMPHLGLVGVSREDIDGLFNKWDRDRTGVIQFNELETVLRGKPNPPSGLSRVRWGQAKATSGQAGNSTSSMVSRLQAIMGDAKKDGPADGANVSRAKATDQGVDADYWNQADETMHTRVAWQVRKRIRKNPMVEDELEKASHCVIPKSHGSRGTMSFKSYCQLQLCIYKVCRAAATRSSAGAHRISHLISVRSPGSPPGAARALTESSQKAPHSLSTRHALRVRGHAGTCRAVQREGCAAVRQERLGQRRGHRRGYEPSEDDGLAV